VALVPAGDGVLEGSVDGVLSRWSLADSTSAHTRGPR